MFCVLCLPVLPLLEWEQKPRVCLVVLPPSQNIGRFCFHVRTKFPQRSSFPFLPLPTAPLFSLLSDPAPTRFHYSPASSPLPPSRRRRRRLPLGGVVPTSKYGVRCPRLQSCHFYSGVEGCKRIRASVKGCERGGSQPERIRREGSRPELRVLVTDQISAHCPLLALVSPVHESPAPELLLAKSIILGFRLTVWRRGNNPLLSVVFTVSALHQRRHRALL